MKLLSVLFASMAVLMMLHDVSADVEEIDNKPMKKKHHKKHHRKHKTTTTILPSEEPIEVREESYFDKDDVISRKSLLQRIAEGQEKIEDQVGEDQSKSSPVPHAFVEASRTFSQGQSEVSDGISEALVGKMTSDEPVHTKTLKEVEDTSRAFSQGQSEVNDGIRSEALVGKMTSDEPVHTKTLKEEPVSVPAVRDEVVFSDVCRTKHCGAGRECEADKDGVAQCVCIKSCPQELEARRQVCTNYNETWGSDCEVYQRRCQCEDDSPACVRPEYAHVHIEYYGECREMPECLPAEMADFPRRMRDWLFHIMRDLADRAELSPHFIALQREAENNMTRRWSNAAVWKFCDLDGHPPDRSVSRHELFPIRAPLMALEHCIAPFLNKCDADEDHLITLKEWARCLEINEEEIEDQCEDVRANEVD